jgi:hypothetical protein
MDAPRLSRLVNDAEKAREAPDSRRQQQNDGKREQKAPQHLGVVAKGV